MFGLRQARRLDRLETIQLNLSLIFDGAIFDPSCRYNRPPEAYPFGKSGEPQKVNNKGLKR
jgi:hypothetical protein